MFRILFSSFSFPNFELLSNIFPYLYILLIVDFIQYKYDDIFGIFKIKRIYQFVIYSVVFVSIILSGVKIKEAIQLGEMEGPKKFIYFQF